MTASFSFHPEDMYAIQPASSGRGWSVSITRRGKLYQRVFSLPRYGSMEAALQAARQWRDSVAPALPAMTRQEMVQLKRRTNTSGCPGVYLFRQKRKLPDGRQREYVYWSARTPEGVKPARTKNFSVLRHGYDQAYEMAVQARQAFVQELTGYRLYHVPEKLHPEEGRPMATPVRMPTRAELAASLGEEIMGRLLADLAKKLRLEANEPVSLLKVRQRMGGGGKVPARTVTQALNLACRRGLVEISEGGVHGAGMLSLTEQGLQAARRRR